MQCSAIFMQSSVPTGCRTMYKCLEDFCKAHILQPKTENAVPEIRKGAAIPIWLLAQQLTAITVETEVKRRKLEEKHTKPAVKRRKLQEKHIKPGKIREEDYNSLSRGPNGTDFSWKCTRLPAFLFIINMKSGKVEPYLQSNMEL